MTNEYKAQIVAGRDNAPYGIGEVMDEFVADSAAVMLAKVELWMWRNVCDGGRRPNVRFTVYGEVKEWGDVIAIIGRTDAGEITKADLLAAGADEDEALTMLA